MDRNFLNLKPYNTEEKLCNCGNDPNITADIQCSSDKVKQCNDSKVNQMHVESGTCSVFGNVNTTPDIGDTHTTMKTSFIPKTDHKAIYPKV